MKVESDKIFDYFSHRILKDLIVAGATWLIVVPATDLQFITFT